MPRYRAGFGPDEASPAKLMTEPGRLLQQHDRRDDYRRRNSKGGGT